MNDLEKNVLSQIGENPDSPDVFTDDGIGIAQIRDSLNDAIEEISALTAATRRPLYLILRSDRSFYRITGQADRVGWIVGAWNYGQTRRLERTDVNRLRQFNPRWMENSGTVESYFQVGWDIVGFWPQTTASAVVELDCVMIPARYETGTARVKLRREYERAAVNYAVSEYWASRGDARSALNAFKRYADAMGLNIAYNWAADKNFKLQTHKEPWAKATGG